MGVTTDQFRDALSKYGILTEAQLAALPQNATDAESLARDFVQQGALTKFQALNVYHGRAKGLVFGEYVVLDKIGAGGMGQVFKAQHRRMKRIVALKVLPAQAVGSPKAVQRFYQEVEVAAKLSHPNIVTAHDAGEAHGMNFLVMEYVEGRDLSSLVNKQGPLGVEQAANLVLQAARGLVYAHGLGIIHRDIKPSNLLLDRRGCVKILDMGLARYDNPMADASVPASDLTASGEVMGTVDYMAPEQAQDTRTADHRADIYALGCTLYRLLAGKPPYTGETMIQKILAHREQPIPSLRDLRNDVPEVLDRLYQKMMAKTPADRTPSMDVVVVTLEKLLSGVSEERSSVVLSEEPRPADDAGFSSFALGGGSSNVIPTATPAAAMTSAEASARREFGPGSTLGGMKSPAATQVAKPMQAKRVGDVPAASTVAPPPPRGAIRGVLIGGGIAVVLLVGAALVFALRSQEEPPIGDVAAITVPAIAPSATSPAATAANTAATATTDGPPAVIAPPTAAPSATPTPTPFFGVTLPANELKKRKHDLAGDSPNPPVSQPSATPSATASPTPSGTAVASASPTPPSVPPPVVAETPSTDARVDLLALIDIDRDTVSGTWRKLRGPNGDVLHSPKGGTERIQVPYVPPAEYVLEMVTARRSTGEGGVLLGLVVGGRQCILAVDVQGRTELGSLDNKPMFIKSGPAAEGATEAGKLKSPGESSVVECRVTPRSVKLLIDGAVALDWRGDNRRLSLDPAYRVPNGRILFLSGRIGTYEVTRFQLIPGTIPEEPRQPVPSESEQLKTLAVVKEQLSDDYAKAVRPDEKAALARTLFERAASNADDWTTRYVLLTETRTFAAEQVDFDLLASTIDLLSSEFDVHSGAAAADAWEQALRKPHAAAIHKQLAETALVQLDDAVRDERFSTAERLKEAAVAAARKANDTEIVKRVTDRGKLLAEQATQYDAIQNARTALAADADDPAANLAVGRYLCFSRGDWPAGFARLAKGSDAMFKSLAEKSLAFPVDVSARAALGDAWWNEAAKAKDKTLVDLRSAAAFWYSLAIPELAGVEKVRVEQRLNEIAAANSLAATGAAPRPVRPVAKPSNAKPVDLLKLINPARDTVFSPRAPWTHRGTSLAMPLDAGPANRLQIPSVVPAEYVLTVTASRLGAGRGPLAIGLNVGGAPCCLVLGGNPVRSGLELIDGKPYNGNETTLEGPKTVVIRPDRSTTIICSVRKTGLVVTADDKTIIDWKGDLRRLSIDKRWSTPNPGALFIGSEGGAFEFTKLELAPPTD